MWRFVLPWIVVSIGWAQLLVPPGSRQYREVHQLFEQRAQEKIPPEEKLDCQVSHFPARLNFEFQLWTGYDITLPVSQFSSKGRSGTMAVALRVRPAGTDAPPSYLFSRAGLPRQVPDQYWKLKNVMMNLGGGFLLGEGRYDVSLWLLDAAGRSCRKDWRVVAKAKGVPARMEPNEIADSGVERWRGIEGGSGTLSVYIHAAPMLRRRVTTRLSAWDRAVLAGSLRSLLDVGGFAKARVKVFDFDGRRVLFESEDFGPRDYERMMGSLMNLNLGTVSIQTLKGPSEESFLTELMQEEVKRPEASEAIVFLGPSWRWGPKLTPLAREIRGQLPSTYYLSLTPWFSTATDLIEKFVKAGAKGKVIAVYQPVDLAKAITEIREKRN